MTMATLDQFTRGYIDCALWASSDMDSGESFSSRNYDESDLSPACRAQMIKDCKAFQKSEKKDLAACGGSAEQNGHDFWLTRNGHGAGFWDRGYGAVGDRLSKAAKVYRSSDLYLGDDGKIHCS